MHKDRKKEEKKCGYTIEPSDEEEALVKKVKCLNIIYRRRKLNLVYPDEFISYSARTVYAGVSVTSCQSQEDSRYVVFSYNDLTVNKQTLRSLHHELIKYSPESTLAFYTMVNTDAPRYTDETHEDAVQLYTKVCNDDLYHPGVQLSIMGIAFYIHKQDDLMVGPMLFNTIKSAAIISPSVKISTIGHISDDKTIIQYYILS
jgi:hypothetical protein